MGLDWLPGNKPKPGFEAEFGQIFRQVVESAGRGNQDDLIERFMEISTPAYESLDAPRVGQSEAADRWARETYTKNDLDITEEEFLTEMEGYYVLDLVPPCDGLPQYSNSAFGYVEKYSFRGQFLTDCTEIIGDDLLEKAYENMLTPDFLTYGQTLMKKAEEYAQQAGLDIAKLDNEDPDSTEAKLHVVVSAARWCTFWAERGHILNVDW